MPSFDIRVGVLGMVEGVTTRLQKEVGQLQKDMEKVEVKIDGMAEQLRAEIRLEIMKGMETLCLELVKNGQKTNVPDEETSFGKSVTLIDMESTRNQQKSGVGVGFSSVEMGSILGKHPMVLDIGTSSTFGDPMKLNPRCSKLECPKFDGVDFRV